MKIKSDLTWALVLIAVAAASFFLGIQKGSMNSEEELEEKLKEIRILENKNQQLSDELTSRGIYSYPQANIVSKAQDSVATVLITLNGKDPIEDLKVRREVIQNYSEIQDDSTTTSSSAGRLSDLGTLKPHNPSTFDIPLTKKQVVIQLEYQSGRKKWHQYIWVKKSADGKIRTFWVITNDNSSIIDKHIDPGFLKTTEEEIVLWKGKSVNYSDLEMNSAFPPKD